MLYLFMECRKSNQDWVWRGHVQEVADRLIYSQEAREMIIVMPDAGGDIYKDISPVDRKKYPDAVQEYQF